MVKLMFQHPSPAHNKKTPWKMTQLIKQNTVRVCAEKRSSMNQGRNALAIAAKSGVAPKETVPKTLNKIRNLISILRIRRL